MSESAVRSNRWRAKQTDEQRQSLRAAETERQRRQRKRRAAEENQQEKVTERAMRDDTHKRRRQQRADWRLLSVADRAYVGIARRPFTNGSVEFFCLGAMNDEPALCAL